MSAAPLPSGARIICPICIGMLFPCGKLRISAVPLPLPNPQPHGLCPLFVIGGIIGYGKQSCSRAGPVLLIILFDHLQNAAFEAGNDAASVEHDLNARFRQILWWAMLLHIRPVLTTAAVFELLFEAAMQGDLAKVTSTQGRPIGRSDLSGIFKDEGLSVQGRVTKLEILLKVCAHHRLWTRV